MHYVDEVTIIGPGLLEAYLDDRELYTIVDVCKITNMKEYDTYIGITLAGETLCLSFPLDKLRQLIRYSLVVSKEQLAEEMALDLLGNLP